MSFCLSVWTAQRKRESFLVLVTFWVVHQSILVFGFNWILNLWLIHKVKFAFGLRDVASMVLSVLGDKLLELSPQHYLPRKVVQMRECSHSLAEGSRGELVLHPWFNSECLHKVSRLCVSSYMPKIFLRVLLISVILYLIYFVKTFKTWHVLEIIMIIIKIIKMSYFHYAVVCAIPF